MGEGGCVSAIDLLNFLTDPRVLRQHGDEIVERFMAGQSYSEMLVGLGEKFSRFRSSRRVIEVTHTGEDWPVEHYQPIKQMVLYAVEQAKQGNDFRLKWKGDADYDETLLRIEVREKEMTIEFLHPPAAAQRLTA
jgi:hypothetical protein